jgi:hypothetical protein
MRQQRSVAAPRASCGVASAPIETRLPLGAGHDVTRPEGDKMRYSRVSKTMGC